MVKVDDARDIDKAYEDLASSQRSLREAETQPDGSHDAIPGYDRSSDGLDDREDDFSNPSDQVNDAEKGSSNRWNTNYESFKDNKGPNKAPNKAVTILKKGGPVGIIGGLLLGSTGLIGFFGGPGLLVVHVVETITSKFDMQFPSMEMRKNKILNAKLGNSTKGPLCNSLNKKSILCSYSSMSKKNITAFKDAKIEVIEGGKTITGRTKVKSLKFNGVEIPASQFDKMLRNNPEFRNAIIKSYNSRYIGWSDLKAFKSFGFSKSSKSKPFPKDDMTDEERNKTIQETTKEGDTSGKRPVVECKDPNNCTEEEKKRKQQISEIDPIASNAEQTAKDNIKSAQPSGFKTAVSAVNTLGVLDDLCMIPTMIRGIGDGAKIIRAQQLIRYGLLFMKTASMIKAGDAVNPSDVSFLATKLTTVLRDSDGNLTKSFDQSSAYQMVSGGRGKNNVAVPFTVGGGLAGDISNIGTQLLEVAGAGDAKRGRQVCDIAGNPVVQVVGVLASFIPGAGQGAKAFSLALKESITLAVKKLVEKEAMKAALKTAIKMGGEAVAFSYITDMLVALGSDLASGVVVDDSTVGEAAGNALTTGQIEFSTQTAGFGGNLPLTPAQAVAYNSTREQVLADYQEYDRATKSPFDATSSSTFLGSIYNVAVPYLSNSGSLSSVITSVGSILSSSVRNLTGQSTAKAVSTEDYTDCEDFDYREMGVATTSMCNVIRGIPPQYLDLDPLEVKQYLIDSGDIDEETGEAKSTRYQGFITECLSGKVLNTEYSCMLTGQDEKLHAYFAVNYADQRINDVLENGLPSTTGASGSATPNGSSATVASPEVCKTLPSNDPGQIACHAYQYSNTMYLWGGGHSGTAQQFVDDFHAGKYPPGSATVDCSGLVRMTIFETYGVDIGGVGSDSFFDTGHFEKVPTADAKPGDLIIILGQHVEIIVNNKAGSQSFDTIGAHSSSLPLGQSIGPVSDWYSYSSPSYVLRWKG